MSKVRQGTNQGMWDATQAAKDGPVRIATHRVVCNGMVTDVSGWRAANLLAARQAKQEKAKATIFENAGGRCFFEVASVEPPPASLPNHPVSAPKVERDGSVPNRHADRSALTAKHAQERWELAKQLANEGKVFFYHRKRAVVGVA